MEPLQLTAVPQPLRLISDRLISGRGLLRVPEECLRDRYWVVYIDVVRRPRNEYLSLDWFPPQSVYARCTYRRHGYVQSSDIIKYTKEQRIYVNDVAGQTLIALKGAYDGLLRTIVAAVQPSQPVNINIADIQPYENLALGYDEIIFKCQGDTALQVRLYCKDYDSFISEEQKEDLPPPPPPPLSPIPPGESIGSISAPYTNPLDTITSPSPLDTINGNCDGVGVWRMTLDFENNSLDRTYLIAGRASDTFSLDRSPRSGCPHPAATVWNGVTIFPATGCNDRINSLTGQYLGLVQSYPSTTLGFFPNPLYPGCTGRLV